MTGDEAYAFYADPEHLQIAGPAQKRRPRRGQASCAHIAFSGVIYAACGICGPLRVRAA